MKLRQISFKLVSLVMVFAILFSVSATTISAINLEEEVTKVIENGQLIIIRNGEKFNVQGIKL